METLQSPEAGFDIRERQYHDITTWAAEVLDGNMRTSFEYSFDGQELYAQDGSSMKQIFKDAIADADAIAARNPNLSFEKGRRQTELEEYKDMVMMANGGLPNTMVVVSDFPYALANETQDAGGYNIRRQQTMLRVITASPDGRIKITSQSLDRSDREGLENIYRFFNLQPRQGELLGQRIYYDADPYRQETLIDELVNEYDNMLRQKYGEEFYAGRTSAERENTYEFVLNQPDLINAYLANSSEDNQYALAAALERRWESGSEYYRISTAGNEVYSDESVMGSVISAQAEMDMSAELARDSGKSYSGCGATLTGGGIGAPAEFAILGYGNLASNGNETTALNDQYGSLVFNCQKGHSNTRPYGQLIPCCKTCGISVKC